jgi:hypothetical protein
MMQQSKGLGPEKLEASLVQAADVSVLCYRLMVGTSYIDFEVTSSERCGH